MPNRINKNQIKSNFFFFRINNSDCNFIVGTIASYHWLEKRIWKNFWVSSYLSKRFFLRCLNLSIIWIHKKYFGTRKKCLWFILSFFSFTLRYFEGYTPVLSVSDPDLLKEVLVKDFENFQSRKVHKNE